MTLAAQPEAVAVALGAAAVAMGTPRGPQQAVNPPTLPIPSILPHSLKRSQAQQSNGQQQPSTWMRPHLPWMQHWEYMYCAYYFTLYNSVFELK